MSDGSTANAGFLAFAGERLGKEDPLPQSVDFVDILTAEIFSAVFACKFV
ncbi:hypothetical protein CLOSTMETH_03945 [[Clostridium] methylpentosum DSM 5476]|uniref:Uncharacterized protein n=1 Tax=[Clostridium] methylpentosum DSM 5476 TaxID=537013 RepID=C0EJ92_9FIRM|nr:hypothetical protein CLOSTMETH_03945 [[Clostridium] methylpentosum DSM 5476]